MLTLIFFGLFCLFVAGFIFGPASFRPLCLGHAVCLLPLMLWELDLAFLHASPSAAFSDTFSSLVLLSLGLVLGVGFVWLCWRSVVSFLCLDKL